MNRNRQGRDRGSRSYGGGGDGLLGEGPGIGGGMFEPMVNSQMNQLLLAQQLLQQQAALGGASAFGGVGGDYGMGDLGGLGSVGGMHYLNQGMGYGGGMGGMHNDRKRLGGGGRDNDFKRRRRDSSGRSDRDRSRGRDSNRSGEGKDRNRSNRWDSDKDHDREEGEKGEDDYDPAEPTEDEERKDKDSNLYCHVCNVSVYDDESFRRHLNGMKHTQRMNSLLTVHQMKSNQLKSRLRAEEHLRKIEGKNSGSMDPDYFCKICNNSLTIPWERHRFSNIHKQRQLQVKRGCGWCKVHDFTNFTEVLEHRETEEHKKNAELYGKKKDDSDRSRSRSRSRERRSDKHRSHRRSSSRDRNRKDKDEEDDEDLTIPEFNAETPVGVKYIIPVTGFFCKLCHKFYNNEKSAKGSHCQTDTHYEKFKAATEEKLAAREKRIAEKAAAAEAAQKAKEEEEKRKEAEKDQEMEDDKEAADGKGKKRQKHDDEEDYDDELPLEDVDNEGGLLKDDEFGGDDEGAGASRDDTTTENYVTADESYSYATEDAVQAQGDESAQYQTYADDKIESYSTQDKSDLETTGTEDISMDLSGAVGEKEDESITLSDDESATPTVTSKTPAKGRGGTARRGRGRGKARK